MASTSDFRNAEKSSGEPAMGVTLIALMRLRNSGALSARAAALRTATTISRGVLAGTSNPFQSENSYFG